jgi:hypothetical protein
MELLKNPQEITIVGTAEFELTFDETIFIKGDAVAYIDWVSGTSFQINGNGAIDSTCIKVTSANPKCFFPVKAGTPIRVKGAAGGEVFNISICPQE